MTKTGRKTHYRLHTWSGVVLGVFLYLLCFSGTIAVYKDELVGWANAPTSGVGAGPAPALDGLLADLEGRMPEGETRRRLTFPAGAYGVYELRTRGGARVLADRSGAPLHAHSVALAEFFVNLHTRIFLGHEGRWIVGAAGLGMLAPLLTGLLVHRRLLDNLPRRGTSPRRQLVGWHKLAGLAGFPAYLLLTLTGIWLGLYGLIIPAYEAARARSGAGTAPPVIAATAGRIAPPPETSLDALLTHTCATIPGFEPVFVDWPPPGKGGPATIEVRGNLPGALIQRHRVGVVYRADDGAVISVLAPASMTTGQRVHDSMMPLHVGDWGGPWIKGVYFAFGLLASALCLTGACAWADRRTRQAGWLGGAARWPWHVVIASTASGSLAILLMPAIARWGVDHGLEALFLQLWMAGAVACLVACRLHAGRCPLPRSERRFAGVPPTLAAYGLHALAVIAVGYAQYLSARDAKDADLQGIASWWILVGLGLLAASAVERFYPRLGGGLRGLSALGLAPVAAGSPAAGGLLLALLAIAAGSRLAASRTRGPRPGRPIPGTAAGRRPSAP